MNSARTNLLTHPTKPRILILSDISNEPDDAESLCRYLLYANQFETLGLVAVTSTWLKRKVHPEDMVKIVKAYGKVVPNLNAHVHPDFPYPTEQSLLDLIKTGPQVYGKEALADDQPLSSGAELLISATDASSEPLWVLCWGGTNCLAQALQETERTRSVSASASFRSKLRIHAISDQDDTGLMMRNRYPDLFYICSVHGWNQYGLAAWTGISGDRYYGFDKGGPDFSTMEKEWIKKNIQVGPYGEAYPDYLFIPEGDTSTYLGLIAQGLNVPGRPEWGSWGGRYSLTDLAGSSRHYTDAVDRVKGANGDLFSSNHATIWRWREAFQHDFAARIQWTLSPDFGAANHAPVAIVNHHTPTQPGGADDLAGTEPYYVDAEAGTTVTLDASESYDMDAGQTLSFHWWLYKDITATQWWVDAEVADLAIVPQDEESTIVQVTLPPPEKCCVDLFTREPKKKGQAFHLILEVKDNGTPQLRSYRRVILQATNEELRGGGGTLAECVADVQHVDG